MPLCSQVYVNLFEFFIFWTAFYVLRGTRGAQAAGPGGEFGTPPGPWGRSYMSDIKRMGTSLITGECVVCV